MTQVADPVDEAFARSFVADTSANTPAELVAMLVGEVMKVPARVWRQMFAGLLAYDDLDELARISAATLLVWGDADIVVGHDKQEILVTHIAGAELVVFAASGHTPRWEDPGRFAGEVNGFVERIRV